MSPPSPGSGAEARFPAIVPFALATRGARRAARSAEATLGWRPIDRPGKIAVPSAWLEIAPGQGVHLLEVPGSEPSPFERESGRHIVDSVAKAYLPQLQRRLERFFFRDPDGYVFEVVEAERMPET